MILKFLLVVGVIAVVYFMFIKKTPVSSNTKRKKEETLKDNDMVECAECGVYVEVSEAIISGAKYYCSQECIKKAN